MDPPRKYDPGVRSLPNVKASEIALSDPLKEVTRKERVYLLGVSIVGIAIAKTGLVPQEISTLGITFADADRQSLLNIFALVVLYFLLAFVVYGVSDWLAFTHAYRVAYYDNGEPEETSRIPLDSTGNEDAIPLVTLPYVPGREARRLSPYVARIRSFFEFVLPLLVGFYAIWALISV